MPSTLTNCSSNVAGALACKVHESWEPLNSSRIRIIVQSHGKTLSLVQVFIRALAAHADPDVAVSGFAGDLREMDVLALGGE